MIGKIKIRSAMTRMECLVLICVGLFAAYLVVRYQKSGELIHVGWRKAVKTNSATAPITPSETSANVIEMPDQITDIVETNANSVSTNLAKTTTESTLLEIAQMRLANRQKQTMQVPTNAVWSPTIPRRGPGVRIAFP